MPENSSSKSSLFERFVPILLLVSVALAFGLGYMFKEVSDLKKGITPSTATTTTGAQPAQPTVSLDTIKSLFSKDLIKFGDANRKALFVEVGDPSCPFCQAAGGENHSGIQGPSFKLIADGGTYDAPVPEMRKLVDAGKASFVYIYYPGHNNGEMGMKSLYCANEKGKFWEAHDLIMGDAGYNLMNNTVKNDKTQSGAISDFLKSAVDPSFLKSCLDSGKYDARLTSDQALATSLGIQGTPGFFVNVTSYPGAYNWTDMKSTVDSALK